MLTAGLLWGVSFGNRLAAGGFDQDNSKSLCHTFLNTFLGHPASLASLASGELVDFFYSFFFFCLCMTEDLLETF